MLAALKAEQELAAATFIPAVIQVPRKPDEAIAVLVGLVEHHPNYVDAYLLLGELFEKASRLKDARSLYRRAAKNLELPDRDKAHFQRRLRMLPPTK